MPNDQQRTEADKQRLLIDLVTDFDGALRRRGLHKRADHYAKQQREVAQKATRHPPKSIEGMRF